MTNIIEELPPELIAIILQYHLYTYDELEPCDLIKSIKSVLNGPHRQSIIDAHTTIEIINNNSCKTITYFLNGKLHRENGPAYESYYETGNILNRSWYINGERHRENGPAYESYSEDGNISWRWWYINGKQLTEKEFNNKE